MQKVSVMPIGNLSAVNSAGNAGKSFGQSKDFQTCMDNTQNQFNSSDQTKGITETKVVNDSKTLDRPDQNDSVYEVSDSADVTKGSVSEQALTVVENAVKAVLKSVLHMDETELEAIMSEMGISYVQLLDPAVLQQFVMVVNQGSDVTDFLTNEVMLEDFTELSQALEEVDWEELTGMSKQEFVKMLETALNEDGLTEGTTVQPEENPELFFLREDDQNTVTDVWEESQILSEKKDAVASQKGISNTTETVKGEPDSFLQDNSLQIAGNSDSEEAGQSSFQSGTGSQGGFYQELLQEPANGQPVTVMNFVENLTQSVSREDTPVTAKMQQMIDIVNQVVERINTSIHEDTTTMEMQLNPESLGKVLLSVSNKNGVMTASFTVQTEEAREALESQMHTLRDNLEQKNLKVESVEVSVSDFEFSQSNQADTSDQKNFNQGNGKRMRFQFEEEEQETVSAETEAEQVRRSVMRDSGSSIDYTA
ncbi:MAG: flagellar hook-length control protein FliK [Lachnospiraceae bacterium]|nr:flagellar hook-length control protein FliK [Lachnospiraceae bacterium]